MRLNTYRVPSIQEVFMKRLPVILSLIAVAVLFVFTGCKQPEIDMPPSISFSASISEGDYVSEMVLLEGSASDDKAVSAVELSFDNGVTYNAATGTSAWSYNLDTTLYDDTVLPVRARVRDSSGYYNYAFLNLIVDNQGPVVRIINPTENRPVNGFVPIVGTGNRVTSVQVKVEKVSDDSLVLDWTLAEGTVVWSHVLDVTDMAETDYRVSVQGFRASPYKAGAVVTSTFRVDKTVPEILFTDPASASNVITYLKDTVLFAGTAADANGIALVELSFNGGTTWENASGTTSWSVMKDTTALGDGIRTVVARAKDSTGLFSTVNIPVNIDNQPPVVEITQPTENQVVSGVFTARGTSFDAGGVSLVELSLDGAAQVVSGTTNWTSDIDVSALPNGSYPLTAVAKDLGSTDGTPYTIPIVVDNNMPAFDSITGIAQNGYYRGTLAVSGTVSDADAGDTISSVQVKVGTGAFAPVGAFDALAGTWSLNLDTSGYSDGVKTVVFRVTDEWGGYREESFNVVFDNTAPSLSITQPAENAEVAGRVTITGAVGDAYTVDSLRLRIKTNGSGTWDIIADADIKASIAGGLWSYQWEAGALPIGTYQVQVEALDRAGNPSVSNRSLVVSTSVPSISIDAPVNGSYVGGLLSVSGTATTSTGTITGVTVRFNSGTEYDATDTSGGTWSTWSIANLDSTSVSDGVNTITATVNVSTPASNSASVIVNVDNTPPEVAISAPTSAAVGAQALYGPQTITGTASDANLTDVSLIIDGGAPVSLGAETSFSYAWDTATVTGVAGAGKVIQAKAVDLAGNETTTSVTVDVRPHISSLSKVTAVRGDTITITGFNFAAGSTVNFPNAANTAITFTSSTSISVVIPGTATSGLVTVTTNGVVSNGENLDLWQVDTVNGSGTYPFLAQDGSGNMFLAYAYQGGGGTKLVGVRKHDGTSWSTVKQLNSNGGGGYSYTAAAASGTDVYAAYYGYNTIYLHRSANSGDTFGAAVTVTTGSTYAYLSMAASGANVYLSAYDTTAKVLKVFKSGDYGATWPASWTVDASSADTGRFTALGLTAAGNPVIAYRDEINKTLKLAYYTGAEWAEPRTIDTDNVGEYASLKIHSDGSVHIAYFDRLRGDLKYAQASSPSAAFTMETVPSEGIGGMFNSIALDGNGKPHVAYFDFSAYVTYYARKTGASWELFPVPPKTATEVVAYPGTITGIVLDGSGKPVISYPTNEGVLAASFIP